MNTLVWFVYGALVIGLLLGCALDIVRLERQRRKNRHHF
jgi:hypothetical protein